MDTIAPATPALPTELRHRRARIELGPAAAAYACGHVRAAIAAWSVPVNPAVAILLTSDLVINAVTNGADDTITLGIRWSAGQFRVEVHDALVRGDSWETAAADTDAERGLLLAAALSADCGHYRTPAGRAVYFVLACEAAVSRGDAPPCPPGVTPACPPAPSDGPDGENSPRLRPAERDGIAQEVAPSWAAASGDGEP